LKKNNRQQSVAKLDRRNRLRRSVFEALENRLMLAGDSGRQVFTSPEAVAPSVSQALVSSPVFGSRFADHLVSMGLGTEGGFLRVSSSSLSTFPWTLDRIRVKFTEDVDVVMGDIAIHGVTSPTIQPVAFQYDPLKYEATWILPVVTKDKLDFTLSNHIQSKLTGQFVDGVSNDKDPSSPFVFSLNVLVGDTNRNGLVTSVDVNPIRDSLFSAIGSSNYNIYNDTNGDGRITSVDVNQVRSNLFSRLPIGSPVSATGKLKPSLSRLDSISIDEDSGMQTILFAANSSAGPLSGQSDLRFSVSSSNTLLVNGNSANVTRLGNHYALQFSPLADQFGQTQLTVGITDGAGTTSTSLNLHVLPVNDPPSVQSPSITVELTQQSPVRTIDLNSVFADPEGSVLSYRITRFDASLVAASINGSQLTLRGLENKSGTSAVIIEARDSDGAFISASINTNVELSPFAPLTTIQYSIVSDQIMDFNGQNTFILKTNFDERSRISISSSNPDVLNVEDVSITTVAPRTFQVKVHHTSASYGLTFLQFRVQDVVFADVAVIVMPENYQSNVDFGDVSVKLTQETLEDGTISVMKEFNDRFVASQLRANSISASTAFSMIRPASVFDTMYIHGVHGGAVSYSAESTGGKSGWSALSKASYQSPHTKSPHTKSPHTNRTTVKATISKGSVNYREEVITPSGKTWYETFNVFGKHFGDELNGQFNVSEDPFNGANFFGWQAIGTSLGNAVVSATAKTVYEVNPAVFGNDTKNLGAVLNTIDTVHALVGLKIKLTSMSDIYKSLSSLVKTDPEYYIKLSQAFPVLNSKSLATALAVRDGLKTQLDFAAQANDLISLLKPTGAAEAIAINQSMRDNFFNATTSFSQDILTSTQSISDNLLNFSETGFREYIDEAQLIQAKDSVLQATVGREIVLASETTFSDRIVADNQPDISADDIPEMENGEVPNADAIGENGDQEDAINEVIANAYKDKYQGLANTLVAGKKIYDIVKSMQSIVGQIGQLFDAISSKEGDYTDNDGRTYNMFDAQRGSNARHGSSDRDIINTGYKSDQVYGYGGDDRISTLEGDDELYGGEGRNTYFAGPGNDLLVDGSGSSFLSGGQGDDTFRPGAGNDMIEAGLGQDTIVFEGTDIGNNVIVDPSRSGLIKFQGFTINQLSFRKDRYDLEIIAPSNDGRVSNSLKFVSFFESDAAGWTLIDSIGNDYNLYELTGRITSYQALEIAFKDRGTISHPEYPPDLVHVITLLDSKGRFRVHVAEDRRLIGTYSTVTEPGLLLTFEGDSSLNGWLTRNKFASLEAAIDLMNLLLHEINLPQYKTVSIVGVGEGGLIAQWFSAVASTQGASFVNAHLINTPDISGLISQVVRADVTRAAGETVTLLAAGRPEYTEGFPVLATNYLVNHKDWVSRIGLWAGNDEIYATWKAFDFHHDPLAELPVLFQIRDIEEAHSPTTSGLDFTKLQISDMGLSQIRGVVSFLTVADMTRAFADIPVVLDGKTYNATTNARIALIDDRTIDPDFDFKNDTLDARAVFMNLLHPDVTAETPDSAFELKLDFQAASQLGEHLAPGFIPVTEETLYSQDTTGLRKFGWESIAGIKAGTDRGKATSLERDSVKVQEATFIIDLTGPGAGPGTYNISITLGDREDIQESLQISINGYQSDRVSTMPGDFLTRTYQVSTIDSQLRISFFDIGGQHSYFSVNGISVEKVNYRSSVGISEQLDNDPSVVILTQSYDLPETTAGIEVFKEALKAAAIAAATVGVGAVLGATSLGSTLGAAVGGTLGNASAATSGAISAAAASGVTLSTKAAILAGIKASIGKAVTAGVLGSLQTSIPQNFVSNPIARGILVRSISIFQKTSINVNHNEMFRENENPGDVLSQINGGLNAIEDGLTKVNAAVAKLKGLNAEYHAPPWIYETVTALTTMTQQFRLGKLDAAFEPVDLEAIERALASKKTPRQLLKLWQGSRNFLVLDWVPTSDSLVKIDADDHRSLVNRSAKVLEALLEAYTEYIQESDADVNLDLLLISHGAGYDINRELANRLNTSEIADRLDYVKLVTLDPIAASQDDYTWHHPEMTSIVDRIDNFYQTEKIEKTWWGKIEPLITFGAGDETSLFQGGAVIGPLDGREGGGSDGFYNRQARIFDLQTNDEILRFRHWDTNAVELSTAELTDIEFSADGTLVAASGKDGMVTVRYVNDYTDPATGEVSRAGKVKFTVWGHQTMVRSVAFMQMEVDGVWKDYLLTISAANDPNNNDIDKNKVLLTEVETGLPVWQGKDVAGTQVEASPSGNVIVSSDSRGNAKIWKRAAGTVTFVEPNSSVTVYDGPNSDYVADLLIINDNFFVTAGLNGRMKLFKITDSTATLVQTEVFDNPTEGAVRNLDYDPYNGILAVAAGEQLSLWRFDQNFGILSPLAPPGQQSPPKFSIHDHVEDIQGVAFSKPEFLLDANGQYYGDRTVKKADGTVEKIPRTRFGDIDRNLLPTFLSSNGFSTSYAGLKLLTGAEDKTLFLYSFDGLDVGSITEENVLSGSMLPIREVTISPNGRRIAVVGEDNIVGNYGGPVKDIDVTAALDDRLGWAFSELFLSGRREHNAVPQQYIYDVIEEKGESYFWLRNTDKANLPGNLDKTRNLSLPPNKRNNIEGVDIAEMDMYLRPGQTLEILPLQWLLETNRKDYQVDQATLVLGDVKDPNGVIVGTIRLKRSDFGQIRPNIFVFEAAGNLDYSAANKNEFVGIFKFDIVGSNDLEGNSRRIEDAEITFRIINHKPTAYRDIVNLHPNRQMIDLRPRLNDYDFDNDDFSITPVPVTWQLLTYKVGGNNYEVARYKRNPTEQSAKRGVDIEVMVTEEHLAEILNAEATVAKAAGRVPSNYISVEFEYKVKEDKYKAISKGIVEVRLQLQAGPENVRYSELGADQVLIQWDPVTWGSTDNSIKYVIERYEDALGWVKHSPISDVDGKISKSLRIKIQPNTDYWLRVVAKNIDSGREHASYDGTDKALMLHVPATYYVGPGSVKMESLGPSQLEVRWEKVFWDVDRYRIDLHRIELDVNGQPLKDGNGNYVYNLNNSRYEVVQEGEGLAFTFKGLDSGTPYLAVVTAKNIGSVSKSTVAEFPIFTSERQIPAGINPVRVGPQKVKVSWGTVDYASKYRAVAINPVTLVRSTSDTLDAVNSRNTNEVIINGLSAQASYVIFVEAKSRKSGEWVTLVNDDPNTPVLPHRNILPGDFYLDSGAGVKSTYLIPYSFVNSITLPSLQGLIAGTEFTLVNFSAQTVILHATDGEIFIAGTSSTTQTLKPAYGNTLSANGAVVYGFVASPVPAQPGRLRWEVRIGDETSTARVVTTPSFLAAEPFVTGEILKKSQDSLPKRLKIDWITPFWEVSRHRIEIFNYDPVSKATSRVPGVAVGDQIISNVTGKDRSHAFEGLTPDTNYLVRLTTVGDGNTLVYEAPFKTDPQRSPSGVYATDHTLSSFTANWTPEKWNVQRYRVSFAKEGTDGNLIESTREYRIILDVNKTSQVINGLESGVTYSFTVEAESADYGWVPNTPENVKKATILLPSDLRVSGLRLDAARNKQLDLSWDKLKFVPESLFFEIADAGSNVWIQRNGDAVGIGATTKSLETMEINHNYDVRLVAKVKDSSGTGYRIESSAISAKTQWVILGLDNVTETEVTVEFPRLSSATKYDIRIYEKATGTLYDTLLLDQNDNNPRRPTVKGLLSGTWFEVEVVARDGLTILATTPRQSLQTRPLIAARGLTTFDRTTFSIGLSWTRLAWTPDSERILLKRSDSSSWTAIAPVVLTKEERENASIVITGLDHGVSYDFKHQVVVHTIKREQTLESDPATESTKSAQGPTGVKIVSEETGRHVFVVDWNHPSIDDISGFTVEVFDGMAWRRVAFKDSSGNFVDGTGVAKISSQFKVTYIRDDENNWKLVKAGTIYLVRVLANYPNNVQIPNTDSPAVQVATSPLVTATNITVSDITTSQIRLSWDHIDPVGGIEFFRIRMKGEGDTNWFVVKPDLAANDRRSLITDLVAGRKYEFQIRAVYVQSDFDRDFESADAVTGPHSTISAPSVTGLSTSDPKTTSVVVNWDRLTGVGVTHYEVLVYKSGAVIQTLKSDQSSSQRQSKEVGNLEAGTSYEIRVVAFNGNYSLSASNLQEFSTLIEGLTVDEESPFSARANWTQFVGSGATDYRVRVLLPGTNTLVSQKIVSIGSGFRRSTVVGLKPSVNYDMIVEVLKNQTVLSYSNRVAFITKEASLKGVSTTDVRRFSIDVAWNSVAEWATITKVQWRKVGANSWSGSGELSGSRTTYSITGLDKATAYEIKVFVNGNGIYDEAIITRTTADFVKPSTPTFTPVGTREITVNWTHEDPAGSPSGFAIFRNGQKVADVGADALAFRDTGLQPNKTYAYFIRSNYSLGSADSPSANGSTLPVNYFAASITSITNVRPGKVDVNWTFDGDINEVESFTIHRGNTEKTQLGLTNPANFPGQTSFKKEISRDADAKWWIFVRVRYKDGSIRDSALVQLP
jgi:hypothetical protein